MKRLFILIVLFPLFLQAQIHTERVLIMGRNALYYDDYALSINYFSQVISAKPYLSEPYYYRALAKFYLEDYTGAERDCSAAIERNPFVVQSYQLRGLCRIKIENFNGAIADYSTVIAYERENQTAWHNRVLCHLNQKAYQQASLELDTLLSIWPSYYQGYNIKAQIALEQKDSTQALDFLDKSLQLNDTEAQTWAIRGGILLQKGVYPASDSAYTRAIALQPKETGNYINRALARYHQKKLREAMADYDQALTIDPENFLGHYNRGLLRAQVGDDNNAITDFDFVLQRDPEDMLALYNRAVLLEQTGDYRGAIRDYSRVIDSYPNFFAGYERRAFCYRKIGETNRALADERKVYIEQIERTFSNNRTQSTAKTRKRKERNIQDYRKMVVEDDDNKTVYEDEFRGKIQNKKVEVVRLPLFELSLADGVGADRGRVAYWVDLDAWNRHHKNEYGEMVLIAQASASSRTPVDSLFARVKRLEKVLKQHPSVDMYLLRALFYTQMHDFENAMQDLNSAINMDSTSVLPLFQLAVVRLRQHKAERREPRDELSRENTGKTLPLMGEGRLALTASLNDMEKVIERSASKAFAYYNKGCILMDMGENLAAAACFTQAIALDSRMAEAYYNRGLAHFRLQKRAEGFADLSKAGELGLYNAYSAIKQFSQNAPNSSN